MATTTIRIDPATKTATARTLPRVCMHCGAPSTGRREVRGFKRAPAAEGLGARLGKEAATLAAALVFGPMGYAAARGACQQPVEAFVEMPVCDACRATDGRGITVLAVRSRRVELDCVSDAFAAATKQQENGDADSRPRTRRRRVRRPRAGGRR
jgi:hypothetical protein